MRRAIAVLLASMATLTAATMAASGAWDRGGTALDRALLVALGVSIVAGVHLMPALLSRARLRWLLWAGCLLGSLYGSTVFFVHAGMRAGEARTHNSAQVAGTASQIQTARDALASITARPVAVVAAQLADTHGRRARAALRLELEESRRAERLQDKLATLEATQTQAEVTGAADPVIARLAEVTGSSEAAVGLVIGLLFSLLLELLGAVLWIEALRQPHGQPQDYPKADTQPAAQDPLADLRRAIDAGDCKLTVAGIRAHVGCSQARALELRRALNG